ncbi:exodeoxyribonuclease VII large subunit, partial [bacterium]|nr:exodeoxyribonuclease VII large subunit [bacterium]
NQLAFEQLKKKLAAEGLFDEEYKKPIPFLPSKITIISSGTSAAVQDIINVSQRRFPGYPVEIISVNVQGAESENEICTAIKFVNQHKKSNLIILARGGGSLEDLASFNSESIAYAIFKSKIPVITGLGHETDFTIADFAADLRAPTPSAAAELAFQDKTALMNKISGLKENLNLSFKKVLKNLRSAMFDLMGRLKNPQTIIYDNRLRLDDYESRLNNIIKQYIQNNKNKLFYLTDKLKALNPEAVLKRGYSIARFLSDKKVIFNSNHVKPNDEIQVILYKGNLITEVKKIDGKKKNI